MPSWGCARGGGAPAPPLHGRRRRRWGGRYGGCGRCCCVVGARGSMARLETMPAFGFALGRRDGEGGCAARSCGAQCAVGRWRGGAKPARSGCTSWLGTRSRLGRSGEVLVCLLGFRRLSVRELMPGYGAHGIGVCRCAGSVTALSLVVLRGQTVVGNNSRRRLIFQSVRDCTPSF